MIFFECKTISESTFTEIDIVYYCFQETEEQEWLVDRKKGGKCEGMKRSKTRTEKVTSWIFISAIIIGFIWLFVYIISKGG